MMFTRRRKLVLTVALFALAVALVAGAADVQGTAPLFAAWIPLLAVPWLLTRPEPDGSSLSGAPGETEATESASKREAED